MLRWLIRLLVLGAIAVAAAMVVSRLTNRDEDFDDFDDLDAGFDFQETPVEIEVPAEQYAGAGNRSSGGGGGAKSESSGATSTSDSGVNSDADANGSGNSNGNGSSMDTARLSSGENLTDIVGIGPAFDARLKAIGINTMADLSQADANSISEQLDVIGGVATIEDWIAQAKGLASGEASNGNEQ